MSFEGLLKTRAIERVDIKPSEIAGLLGVARRDIATAGSLVNTDLDWAFAIAYNAILQLSIAYMASLGYRPRGEGKHYNTFRFMAEALPDEASSIRRLQKLRKKRNETIYEQTGVVGDAEARDVIAFAARYFDSILARLPREVTDRFEKEDRT